MCVSEYTLLYEVSSTERLAEGRESNDQYNDLMCRDHTESRLDMMDNGSRSGVFAGMLGQVVPSAHSEQIHEESVLCRGFKQNITSSWG